MLLKSASTPVLGSLLSSISDSPSHHQSDHTTAKLTPSSSYSKLFQCHHSGTQHYLISSTVSCDSSPMSSPAVGLRNGFRRAQSESNLEGLLANDGTSSNCNYSNSIDEFSFTNMPKRFARKSISSFLETIPSFSYHNNLRCQSEDYEDSDEEDEEVNKDSQYCMENWNLQGNKGFPNEGYGDVKYEEERGEMYLARGLGVAEICYTDVGEPPCGGGGGGDGGSYRPVAFDRDGGDSSHGGIGVEEHYQKMVVENPGNSLFLRNYAQFLYQIKGDLQGAEEFYSRAILADPSDGEVLSQYGKLVWELHRDKDRAMNYFERAVQAASGDSHVHAAYASFLWEVEEDDQDETLQAATPETPDLFHAGAMFPVAI